MQIYTSAMAVARYCARFAPTLCIYGNVEPSNAEVRSMMRKTNLRFPLLTNDLKKIKNFKLINNSLATIKGVRIGGLEYFVDDVWVTSFIDRTQKGYKKRFERAKKQTTFARSILQKLGKVDILVHHQPPPWVSRQS